MVMLSRLCSFTVVDAQRRHTTLADLAVLGLEDDYPPVTHLCFHLHDTPLRVLPWEAVQAIDWRARRRHGGCRRGPTRSPELERTSAKSRNRSEGSRRLS